MALAAVASAQTRPARVLFTYRDNAAQEGYRLGDECFVPVETLNAFGWNVFLRDGTAEVKVAGKVQKAPVREVAGRRMIPLRLLVSRIGGGSAWRENGDDLVVYATLKSFAGDKASVQPVFSLPVDVVPIALADADRLTFDLRGARLEGRPRLPAGVELRQSEPDVVRMTVKISGPVELLPGSLRPGESPKLAWKPRGRGPEPTAQPTASPEPVRAAPPVVLAPPPGEVSQEKTGVLPPTVVEGQPAVGPLPIFLQSETPAATFLTISLRGMRHGPARLVRSTPTSIEIMLPEIEMDAPDANENYGEAVRAVSVERTDEGTLVRIVPVRPVGVELSSDDGGVEIRLIRSAVATSLAGKIIVVDPGHGGKDRGSNRAGVFEKTLALRIGLELSRKLTAAGATVILTRNDDTFVSLAGRAAIAQRNRADLFISCHINSSAADNRTSGTITFYHGGSVGGEKLARAVHRQLGPATGLPSIGAWSDKRIYRTGFAVLRQTRMPGILVELGFVNHVFDRARLVRPDFAPRAADAIVRGVKDFFADVP